MKRIAQWMLCLAACTTALPAVASEPNLSLTLTDPATGAQVRVDPGARALHLVFLAAWCSPCVEELEALTELEARWNGQGYRLVLIAVATRHTPERLSRFAADQRLPGEFLFDATGSAGKSLGARGLPTHVVFDAGGREVFRSQSFEDGVADAIRGLLKEPFGGTSP